MLEAQDLQKITEIVEKSEKRITETVIKEVVESVSELTDNLEKNLMGTLADKESINRMMDQSLERDQQLDKKIDTMAGFLATKKALDATEAAQLQAIKVFGASAAPPQ